MATKKPANETLAPIPPKFTPRLQVRVTDGRSKRVAEFSFDVPLEGHLIDIFPLFRKLRAVLETFGLMPVEVTKPVSTDAPTSRPGATSR